jgi:hypothetical protein
MERAPKASVADLASRAVASLKVSLQNQGISLGEHAHLRDGATGQILTAPFGVADPSATAMAAAPLPANRSNGTPVNANQIVIPKIESDELFELQPSTPETLALVESAAALPNLDRYPAIVMQRDLELIINRDQSIRENVKARNYLASRESFDRWANYRFPQMPPGEVTRVNAARLILPDGSSYVLNAGKLNESARGGVASLLFPQAEPGSLVELDYTTDRRASFGLPRFYLEKELADSVPVKRLSIDLKLPKGEAFHHTLKNLEAEPVAGETEHSQAFVWNFTDLAPYEPLPNDPPRREVVPWLGVSAFDTWDDFSGWFRRISEGAFDSGPRVKEKAAEIAANNPSREDRIRAAYQFVTGLRFVATPCGLHAFRPRTPEQTLHNRYGDCKDKANLLVALLQEMEIDADFVLINRGSSTDPEFPGWQFNHAIAYLPPADGKGDGMWLDSTDPSTPFGVVAPGNVFRNALVFEEDKAGFKMVKPQGDAVGEIVETWDLKMDEPEDINPGENRQVEGRLTVKWSGILTHGPRATFSGMTPLVLRTFLQGMMNPRLPLSEFTNIAVTDPLDLVEPLTLSTDVTTRFRRWPGPPPELTAPFASASRPRAMELNDGQPLRFTQTVKLVLPEEIAGFSQLWRPFDIVLDGQTFRIRYQLLGRNLERVAECHIDNPRITAEQYPAVRAAMREWADALEIPGEFGL